MSLRSRRSRARLAAAVLVAGAGIGVVARAASDGPAVVSETAVREFEPPGDMVVIYDIGDVDTFVVQAAARVATAAGGNSTTARTGSLGMRDIRRNGVVVHAPPAGYYIPTVFISIPENPMGRIMGVDVPPVLGPDQAVMNEVTAAVTGAQVGDVVTVRGSNGATVPLEISGIRPYAQIGWAELVFTTDVAARLGFTGDTQVILHDVDRARVEPALQAEGLIGRTDTKVERSWDLFDPDSTISTARLKQRLGEPWYRYDSDGSISMHPDWIATNLTDGRVLLNESIRIRAQCHVGVVADLQAALADVAAAGLASAIEVANANAYGGCYAGARLSRVSGFLSRHSFGVALDTNTVSNCQGCVPKMHCEVVRIFRRHGFAWGGNFRRPDGMHFEWVGEPRDQVSYPSTYCPNTVAPLAEAAPPAELGVGVLVPDLEAIWAIDHDHPHGP